MKPEIRTIKLSDVVFDEVIYPRKDHDPALVQRYAEVIEEIEAAQKFICVAEDMKLLDGKHRWLAYRKRYEEEDLEISALVYPVTAPHDQLELAAKLNSDHGWQLTRDDKEEVAKALYSYGMSYDKIAKALSVSKKQISDWLSRTVKENKAKRDRRIRDLWLACYTQEEIADDAGCDQKTASSVANDFRKSVLENQIPKLASPANHTDPDFEPPIYNVWKQQTKSGSLSHFGNSEASFVDRLLYLYTEPFDIVVDPFAGSGSTINVCKKRLRRYWVSDRKPIVEREKDIRQHDITSGLPSIPRWKDVKLVYLDPPYWKQAEGRYSDDPQDLANMTLEDFTTALASLVRDFAKKLQSGAHIALIIQPTQWKAEDKAFTDHAADMIRLVKLPIAQRIQAPYESQQCTAQMVEWAKANRQVLVISREIVVWRVS